jgi:hypothetical protein
MIATSPWGAIALVGLGTYAVACRGPVPTPGAIGGRWELVARIHAIGPSEPPGMRVAIVISRVQEDSLFGTFLIAFAPVTPQNDSLCAELRGTRSAGSRVSLVGFTVDDSTMDSFIDGEIRGDSLFVDSYRPRFGKSVLPLGSKLLFVRQSMRSASSHSGCLAGA